MSPECHSDSSTMTMVFGPCTCPGCTGVPMPDQPKWISNPHAFGAIGFYPVKGKPSVGGIVDREGMSTGNFGGNKIYEGTAIDAMRAVEQAYLNSIKEQQT